MRKTIIDSTTLLAGIIMTALCATPALTEDSRSEACAALVTTSFQTVQDASTQITQVASVKTAGNVPAHCEVRGYVAPQVGFEHKLPMAHWNVSMTARTEIISGEFTTPIGEGIENLSDLYSGPERIS